MQEATGCGQKRPRRVAPGNEPVPIAHQLRRMGANQALCLANSWKKTKAKVGELAPLGEDMRRWVQIRPIPGRPWADLEYEVSVEERTKDEDVSISCRVSGWEDVLFWVKAAIKEAARREQRDEVLETTVGQPRHCQHCGSEEHWTSGHD